MSWIDAITRWQIRHGIPWWAFTATLFLVFAAALNAVKWIDGSQTFPELSRLTFDAFYPVAALAGYRLLTSAAGAALDRFQPALDEPQERTEKSRRRLTSMPIGQSLISLTAGTAFGALTVATEQSSLDRLTTSPLAFVVLGVIGYVLGYGAIIVVFWQIVRTLFEVTSLHRRATHLELFRTGPAHAFAPVTAGAGAFLLVNVTYSAITDPATFTSTAELGLFLVVSLVALGAFVLPLLGMRNRLVAEKRRSIDEFAVRATRVSDDLARAIDEGRYDSVEVIRDALDAVTAQRERARRASAWPWDASTLSAFATTLLVPLVVWAVTTYAGRVLGL